MWSGNGEIAQAIGILPAKVWNVDVRAEQALSHDGEAA
jgi:hypothetical protein